MVATRRASWIVLLPLAIVCGLTAPTILDVTNTVYASGNVGSALDHARNAMFVAAAVLLVVGAAIGFFDDRLEFSERTAQSGLDEKASRPRA